MIITEQETQIMSPGASPLPQIMHRREQQEELEAQQLQFNPLPALRQLLSKVGDGRLPIESGQSAEVGVDAARQQSRRITRS